MDNNVSESLKALRAAIDLIDRQIVEILAARFLITGLVGKLKLKHKIPLVDKKREKEVLSQIRRIAGPLNIDEAFIAKIFQAIIKEARKNYHTIKKRNAEKKLSNKT